MVSVGLTRAEEAAVVEEVATALMEEKATGIAVGGYLLPFVAEYLDGLKRSSAGEGGAEASGYAEKYPAITVIGCALLSKGLRIAPGDTPAQFIVKNAQVCTGRLGPASVEALARAVPSRRVVEDLADTVELNMPGPGSVVVSARAAASGTLCYVSFDCGDERRFVVPQEGGV